MTDPTDNNARVVFNCGASNIPCLFDNISLKEDLLSEFDKKGSEIPEDFLLYPNYPNPFNPVTTIKYALPELSYVKIEIFNVLGKNVSKLIDSQQEAGVHELKFDASNLSSGVYFYQVEFKSIKGDKSYSSVNKMLLIK
jgi:hypothetical protein